MAFVIPGVLSSGLIIYRCDVRVVLLTGDIRELGLINKRQ